VSDCAKAGLPNNKVQTSNNTFFMICPFEAERQSPA
jgi:hypothetical protein